MNPLRADQRDGSKEQHDGISAYVDLKTDNSDYTEYYKCLRHKRHLSVNAPADCYKNACSDILAVIEFRVTTGEWKPPSKEAL